MLRRQKRYAGFSLVEISICLVLVCALGAGIANNLSAQVDRARERSTVTHQEAIRDALLGYLVVHGRLPCPADPLRATGVTNAGVANGAAGSDCFGGYAGVVPWVTLGVNETDPWGRRVWYRVARDLANFVNECDPTITRTRICASAPAPATYPANLDSLEVRVRALAGAPPAGTEPIAPGLAMVLVSAGPNGHFAALPDGTRVPADSATLADEHRNSTPASVSFVTRDRSSGTPGCADENSGRPLCAFDDIVHWISRATVMSTLAKADLLR